MLKLKHLQILLLTVLLITQNAPSRANECNSKYQWCCDSGECINSELRCDGIKQCRDGSDEIAEHCIHMQCPKYAFRCAYGGCITGTYQCNGRRDCADNSDETEFLCVKTESEIEREIRGTCSSPTALQCKSGECIRTEDSCDGFVDCRDGSDETVELCSHLYCPSYAFHCGYGACIRGTAKCDGNLDCADGSDEAAELCGYQRRNISATTDSPPITTTSTAKAPARFDVCIIPYSRRSLIVKNDKTGEIIELGEHVTEGTKVSFACAADWQLRGAKDSVCNRNGIWSHRLPTCIKYCSVNTLKRGLSTEATCYHHRKPANCLLPLPVGAKAHITCRPGYTLLPQGKQRLQKVLTCDPDAEWDYPKFQCTPECGTLADDADDDYSSATIMPWDVSIFMRTFEPIFQRKCSGAIISPKMIISAASCFISNDSDHPHSAVFYNVVEGYHVNDYAQDHQNADRIAHNISEIVLSDFLNSDRTTVTHDLAILVLINHFQFTPYLKPICVDFLNYKLGNANQVLQPYETNEQVLRDTQNITDIGSAIGHSSGNNDGVNDRHMTLVNIVSRKYENSQIGLINVHVFRQFIKEQLARYNYLL